MLIHKPMGDIPILLTVLFVVLHWFGAITWSWLWVLSPLWIAVIILFFDARFNGNK